MSAPLSKEEIQDKLEGLNDILWGLCGKYLSFPYHDYDVGFYEIPEPDGADLDGQIDDPERAVEEFLSDILDSFQGNVYIDPKEDPREARMQEDIRHVREEDLMEMFKAPILDARTALNAAFYQLTGAGWKKYFSMFDLHWPFGMLAVCVQESWFVLLGDCFD